MEKRVVIITGPTGSGKSEVAFRLAQKLQTEIIIADSRQVYAGLRIGSAQPEIEKQKQVKYHLLAKYRLDENFNAARFEEAALEIMSKILSENKIPVVEGGAGLYLRALVDGIVNIPGETEEQRKVLNYLLQTKGREYVYNLLCTEDPDAAKTLVPQNYKRVIRALEVKRSTGKSILWYYENQKYRSDFNFIQFGLARKREDLYHRINKRVDKMISEGLADEVAGILKQGYKTEINPLNTVGYKEIFAYLRGEIQIDEAIELIKRNSRRYAKRQLTWFRRDTRINWIEVPKGDNYDSVINKIISKINEKL